MTVINKIVCLEISYVKCIFVVPILSIITALFFLLFMYWYPILRFKFFYSQTTFERAKYLAIFGNSK